MNRLGLQARTVVPVLKTFLTGRLANGLSRNFVTVRSLSPCVCCITWRVQTGRSMGAMNTRRASYTTEKKSQYPNVKTSVAILENPDFRRNVAEFAEELGVNISDIRNLLAFVIHESYLLTNAKKLSGQYESNEKLAFLGAQTMRKSVAEYLHNNFPELSARESWDVQNGLLEDYVFQRAEGWKISPFVLYTRQSRELMLQQAVLALIGAVYTYESPEKADAFVQSYMIPELTTDDIKHLVKLQHPKFILRELVDNAQQFPLKTRIDETRKSKSHLHLDNAYMYSVSVIQGRDKEVVAQVVDKHMLPLAEKKACQQALTAHYPEEFKKYQLRLDDDDFVTEADVDLGLIVSDQRVIEMDKGNESFGFHIKGGEKRKGSNEQWLIYHYTTPVFISHIVPGGLADRHGGLSVGDKILAVNDRSVEGLDHERAINLLKSVSGHITLTVTHSKEALIADQVELKYKDMRRKKRVAELASDVWSEWHQAQANRRPSQYKDVLSYDRLPQKTHKPPSQ